ncbi:hypothetical protein ACMD2_03265 [Ananas comosus]|uniref:Uncharacterized protein n=1 Tax=Ananas comosus TaxID=4615 RepID=A0A199V110_ANACO|nr:hypothetical protein ACMD2_03265 [Ananas comosus]
MSKPRFFLALLLMAVLLSLSFSQGFGRRIQVMSHSLEPLHEESLKIRREMTEEEEMDYSGPKANTNPKDGGIYNSPAPILPPPSH